MFKNYITVALRNIIRHKAHSLIAIAGLAVGMACFLLVTFFILFERSYDDFHRNGKDIYLVVRENYGENYTDQKAITGAPLAPLLKENIAAVETAVRLTCFRGDLVGRGEQFFAERRFFFADEDFFKVFTFPLKEGDDNTALAEPLSVVLTEETARKYFGDEDPIGKVLSYSLSGPRFDFKVTGILKPIPRNSHLQFDFLASYSSLRLIISGDYFFTQHWDSPTWTYVKLGQGQASKRVDDLLPAFTEKFVDKWSYASISHHLLPLKEVYFNSPGPAIGLHGSRQTVLILSSIAAFILLIACINFMNLATARSESRAKEIGLRKVVGAQRRQLVRQFLAESLVSSSLALLVSIGLVELFLPAFSRFSGKEISIQYLKDPACLAAMIVTAMGVGLGAGAYPALFLSSLRPFFVLKGTDPRRGRGIFIRQALVVGQFAISITLIASVALLLRQIRFLQNADVGFNKSHVLTIPIRDRAVRERLDLLKNRWLAIPSVVAVTASSMEPGVTSQNGINISARSNPDVEMGIVYVDPDYVKTFGIELARGRDFSREISADMTGSVLLNEEAVRRLEWENGVGEPVEMFFKEGGQIVPVYQTTVIGVVKNFNFRDLTTRMQPILMKIDPRRFYYIFIHVDGHNINDSIEGVKRVWNEFQFGQPFEVSFLEDDMNAVYRNFINFAVVSRSATFLAIFISCLGLFGLATFSVEKRIKEIGIRKVLGASTIGIVALLDRDFLKLVLAANILAWPTAYYFANRWLQNFAYRISIGAWAFLLAAALALAVALLTVSYQSIRAAIANPVKSIRYE
jgi:putative ABC transport system permease protein